MKVLVLSSFFPASSTDHLPQFLLEQAEAFASLRPDCEFTYLAASNESAPDYQRISDNLDVYRFDYFWPKRAQQLTRYGILAAIRKNRFNYLLLPFLFIFEFFAIRKMIRLIKPDVVYSHWMLPQGVLAYFLTRNTTIKHVLTSHSSDIEALFKIPVVGADLGNKTVAQLSAITVVSQANADNLRSLVSDNLRADLSEKLTVLPMGINSKLTDDVLSRKMKRGITDGHSLLFMGRLTHKKGVFILLQAVKQLIDKGLVIKLVIAGDGILHDEVAYYVDINHLSEYVHLAGFIVDDVKQQMMADADMFVLPSIKTSDGDREGLPVSLLENMAVGTPCVATYGSGAEDVINDSENGFLVNPGSIDELAQKIEQVVALNQDARERIHENATRTISQYRWESLIKSYSSVLLD